ncbi:hypothetical protein [Streptomyces violaceusniger]|uniref:Uncharacterized protein n=1 Tax=Streptomyces violaceusniger (strain Tu 4113) TaxID=653045 RepID=G2PH98_STRV4|nr:hypothetical protein [Streptomyces violaceusniger]AEM88744.1 hypothetical protein Strvi_9493 [Streptomyces violaceusniger Tu 4113]
MPVLPAPAPEPAPAAAGDVFADAWRTTPPVQASELPPVHAPAADPDDALVGLRKAHQDHLPKITLAALRYARANDPDFPDPVDKRGAELLYRAGDLKTWACNRPRAASGTTVLD